MNHPMTTEYCKKLAKDYKINIRVVKFMISAGFHLSPSLESVARIYENVKSNISYWERGDIIIAQKRKTFEMTLDEFVKRIVEQTQYQYSKRLSINEVKINV